MKPHKQKLIKHAKSMRSSPTDAEAMLWHFLRNRNLLGKKFRRQHPWQNYILDFYCHELALVIELDGGQHNSNRQRHYDELRTQALNAAGIKVLRFWNADVLSQTEVVLSAIWNEINTIEAALTPTLSQRERELKPQS